MSETRVETREFEEKTVDKAIEDACSYFGCAREDLDVEIVTRGSTGLFGLGGKKARIKVTVKPEVDTGAGAATEDPQVETPRVMEDSNDGDRDSSRKPVKKEGGLTVSTPVSYEKGRLQQEVGREEIEHRVSMACEITNDILEKSRLSGHADVMEQANRIFVNITGDDLSLIIGREGQTLDALEYIVNLCLRRREPDVRYRVVLEAEGYRERRRKSLISMAERLAIKVKRTGRALSLQPMPARERRIIHMALKDFKGIKTHSSGQGPNRKVVITPARKNRHYRKTRN